MANVADTLLTDARIYLPGGAILPGWLAITEGVITGIGEGTAPAAKEQVSCSGHLVLPGVVDLHVHFRDPGQTHKEDFTSGSLAAAFGGVTTVVDMPNTGTFVRTAQDVAAKVEHLSGRSFVDYALYALLPEEDVELEGLRNAGIAGFKWLMPYETLSGIACQPRTRDVLRDVLNRAAELDILVGVHAESLVWTQDLKRAARARGGRQVSDIIAAHTPFVEALGVAEACLLSHELGFRVHLHHITSEDALETVSALRERLKVRATVETCPQYLFLNESELEAQGPVMLVGPPLRPRQHVAALWNGVRSHEINCVASDHAPHLVEEKTCEDPWNAPSGLIGVETLFPLLFNETLCDNLPLQRLVELTSEVPAAIVGLSTRKGSLVPGHDADLIVAAVDGETLISSESLHSKSSFTPYQGAVLRGAIRQVWRRGQQLIDCGRLVGQPLGRFVRCPAPVRSAQ